MDVNNGYGYKITHIKNGYHGIRKRYITKEIRGAFRISNMAGPISRVLVKNGFHFSFIFLVQKNLINLCVTLVCLSVCRY